MLHTLLVLPSLVLSALGLFSPLQLLLILNSIQSGWWRWEVLGYISFPKCSPDIGVVQVSHLEEFSNVYLPTQYVFSVYILAVV